MNNLTKNLKRIASITKLKLKKHAPTIMTVTGAAGTAGAIVLACKATLKLDDTLTRCQERKAEFEANTASEGHSESLSNDEKMELAKITAKNAAEVAALYLPAAGVEIASVALIFGAHGIMSKRMVALSSAYSSLNALYTSYRKRVKEAYGESVDKDMLFGITEKVVTKTVTDEEGNEHEVVERVSMTENDFSPYAKFFDHYCRGWCDNPEDSLFFLKSVQAMENVKLHANGYLFLNDVYKDLGLEPTKAGQVVGWVDDSDGDGYVSFGIFENDASEATRRFVNGLEPVILLDFNVDGDIINTDRLNKQLLRV